MDKEEKKDNNKEEDFFFFFFFKHPEILTFSANHAVAFVLSCHGDPVWH